MFLIDYSFKTKFVSTHSRPKAAGKDLGYGDIEIIVSTHSRPKAAGSNRGGRDSGGNCVSTHSRPKAAGTSTSTGCLPNECFNTQPPEGGWYGFCLSSVQYDGFNTQPPEGGWPKPPINSKFRISVSTHSRPKAAGGRSHHSHPADNGFNTQPPEGGWRRRW